MKEVELENIIHEMHLRIYVDPHNTDLDWVEGFANLINGNGPCMKVEVDNWPTQNSDARSIVGEYLYLGNKYRYYNLEVE